MRRGYSSPAFTFSGLEKLGSQSSLVPVRSITSRQRLMSRSMTWANSWGVEGQGTIPSFSIFCPTSPLSDATTI